METKRVFLIVLDSFGIGHARDADKFNDEGSDTLGTIRRSRNYYTPNMEFHREPLGGCRRHPKGRIRQLDTGK